jgi:tyrosine-specific transport protein
MSEPMPPLGRIISALFLVTGTTIGGGMLALPVATGLNGFFPSIAIMALCWFCMTATALLLLEATLWFGEGAHMMTMTSVLLGRWGKWVSSIVYIFICYASLVAYTAGGGMLIAMVLNHHFGLHLTKDMGALIFILVFYSVMYMGNKIVGRVNTTLFIAMITAYVFLVGAGISEIKQEFLMQVSWKGSFMAIPFLLTSFSFQTMVPSLVPYLKRNVNALRIAVIAGTLFTFVIYLLWQGIVLGIVPIGGEFGLARAMADGVPATVYLHEHVESLWLAKIADFFAFFAIGTSFLGITFGLIDFLADGMHMQKIGLGKFVIAVIIVIPTLLIATQFERVFMIAMDTSGGFGDALLNGMIPVLMVWVGRYYLGYKSDSPTPGGKVLLIFVFIFFLCAFGIELADRVGLYRQVFEAYQILEVHSFGSIE